MRMNVEIAQYEQWTNNGAKGSGIATKRNAMDVENGGQRVERIMKITINHDRTWIEHYRSASVKVKSAKIYCEQNKNKIFGQITTAKRYLMGKNKITKVNHVSQMNWQTMPFHQSLIQDHLPNSQFMLKRFNH